MLTRIYQRLAVFSILVSLISITYADAPSLGGVAANMTTSVSYIAQFAQALCFILGFGFGVGAIIKYKTYRDNPQQVTLSMPVTLFFIAIAFIFLGIILTVMGQSIFGPGAEAGSAIGVSTF